MAEPLQDYRETIARTAQFLIDLLDALDGDPDLEDDEGWEDADGGGL